MKTVVFLDIDGVICNSKCCATEGTLRTGNRWHGIWTLDASCIEQLNRLTDALDAEIVISSSWRHTREFDKLIEFIHFWGVKADIVGRTDRREDEQRGLECLDWLGDSGRNFLIIDDDSGDIVPHVPAHNFLHIPQGWIRGGLSKKRVDRFFLERKLGDKDVC